MGKVVTKVGKPPKFTPIKITLNITIESREELEKWRREFREGYLSKEAEFATEYSELLADVVESLGELKI